MIKIQPAAWRTLKKKKKKKEKRVITKATSMKDNNTVYRILEVIFLESIHSTIKFKYSFFNWLNIFETLQNLHKSLINIWIAFNLSTFFINLTKILI